MTKVCFQDFKTYYPVKLHTMNPVGRENMQREIDRYWNETK